MFQRSEMLQNHKTNNWYFFQKGTYACKRNWCLLCLEMIDSVSMSNGRFAVQRIAVPDWLLGVELLDFGCVFCWCDVHKMRATVCDNVNAVDLTILEELILVLVWLCSLSATSISGRAIRNRLAQSCQTPLLLHFPRSTSSFPHHSFIPFPHFYTTINSPDSLNSPGT